MKTVDCASVGSVTVTSPMLHLCPHKDEVDEGTVTISWVTRTGKTIELHSLREWLQTWADVKISHEELTDVIRGAVASLPVDAVCVHSDWHTAGMEVTCSTSPTPAAP